MQEHNKHTPREIARLDSNDVYIQLDSSRSGLTSQQVGEQHRCFGYNILPSLPVPPAWKKFIKQFRDLFAILLLVAAGISFISYIIAGYDPYSLKVCIAILGVVLLNAGIGFVQGYMAERSTKMLQKLVPHRARVLRDNEERTLATTELVPGDVILLEEGDEVPADARLVRSYELYTSEISLTGESTPVRKTADPVVETNLTDTELPNLIFMSTIVARGSGVAVVYGTGLDTQFGRVYRLSAQVVERPSPLQIELAAMGRVVSIAAVAIGIVMFVIGRFLGLNLIENLLFALGVMVALVPEGMPATLTVSLALGVSFMAKSKVLIKKLSTLETLGATTIICTDKTGTLTRGQMTVTEIHIPEGEYHFTGTGYAPIGHVADNTGKELKDISQALREAMKCAGLCTTARVVRQKEGGNDWNVIGDPTEGALLTAAAKAGLTPEVLSKYTRIGLLPFDSSRMRMASIHREEGNIIGYVKGAPTSVIEQCGFILENGKERVWSEEERRKALEENNLMAHKTLRVLALARKTLPPESKNWVAEEVESQLCYLGLIGMMDPPRADVIEAVNTAKNAGIR
ncbi:MAG: HAD-IC family P-type ATPase, partial [Dehalococcoidales bacterium]|nr:HAD-IC family P-type ATPase [Dehalococcoidales bacterium]